MQIGDFVQSYNALLSKSVTDLRKKQKVSQGEMAALLQCSPQRIALVEDETTKEVYEFGEIVILSIHLGQEPKDLVTSVLSNAKYRHALDLVYSESSVAQGVTPVTTPCRLPEDLHVGDNIRITLSWSVDGTILACVFADPDDKGDTICVWEVRPDGEPLQPHVIAAGDSITAIAFSPDGKLIAVAGSNDSIDIWDWRQKEAVACLDPLDSNLYPPELWQWINEAGFGGIYKLKFSRDGTILAAVNEDYGGLRLWNTETWTEIRTLSLLKMFDAVDAEQTQTQTRLYEQKGHDGIGEFSVKVLDFTPEGNLILAPYLGHYVWRFDLNGNPVGGEWTEGVNDVDIRSGKVLVISYGKSDGSCEVIALSENSKITAFKNWSDTRRGYSIEEVVFVGPKCVMALVDADTHWAVINALSLHPTPLPGAFVSYLNPPKLSPTGRAVAYYSPHKNLVEIMHIRHELTESAICLMGVSEGDLVGSVNEADLIDNRQGKEIESMPRSSFSGHFVLRGGGYDKAMSDLKTASPAAEGGYGMSELPLSDSTTVNHFVTKARAAGETVALATLAAGKGAIRDIVSSIVGRQLDRGEVTGETFEREVEHQYTVIVIDHAEHLAPDALLWVCSHMRTSTDLFLLVSRSTEMWKKVLEGTGRSEWAGSRSIWVDLLDMVS